MKIVIFGQFCSSSSSSSKVVQRDYLKNHAEPQQNKHTLWVVVAVSRSVSTLCSKRRFCNIFIASCSLAIQKHRRGGHRPRPMNIVTSSYYN